MITSASLTEKMGYPDKDCSNSIIHEALNRGYKHYAFRPEDLFIEDNIVYANAYEVKRSKEKVLSEVEKPSKLKLETLDCIHIRLNPPYDMRYISCLYILSQIKQKTLILNDPDSILLSPEKFIYPELKKFTPPTLISANKQQLLEFWHKHKDVVVKPLYEFAGRGVYRLKKEEENYKTILQTMLEKHKEPVIIQKYIPEVKKGDKRILFFDGEYVGEFFRVPPKGQIQAAYAQGGSIVKSKPTKIEKEIIKILGPILKKRNIFVCGIDMLGDYLTEINTTCPAGQTSIEKLYNKNVRALYWDMVEAKLKSAKKSKK